MEERVRILCVDDEKNVLNALQRVFLDDDYEILTASSGIEGLEIMAGTAPIQVVVSDYRMPEMTGVDFLSEVRKQWPESVRIILSGYADASAAVSAINEGRIFRFIPKPWNDEELRSIIANALDWHFLNRKNNRLAEALHIKVEELRQANHELENTLRRQTLRTAKGGAQLPEEILDALPVGVVTIDAGGAILQCNGEAARLLFGCDCGETGNYAGRALPPEIAGLLTDADSGRPAIARLSLNGEPVAVHARAGTCSGRTVTVLVIVNGE